MPSKTTSILAGILLASSLGCNSRGEGSASASEPPARRIVAIGDLHGDLPQALAVLELAGVVDGEGTWQGGTTVLVQTGDTTDRGPDSKAVLDLMRRLATEAETAGGAVVLLLGNHEVMNLSGDWRYVHPGDVEAFGGEAARREALALDGTYGSWLATLPVVAVVDGVVFAHGGMGTAWAERGVDGTNAVFRTALTGGDASALGPDDPTWYRGFVEDPEPLACPRLERSLAALGAARMVVGHTTRRDGRIGVRCDGRLHAIDVGIASHYGGNLAAWELTDMDARALYPTGPVDLEDPDP